MPTQETALPLTVRIRGDLDRAAAGDLTAGLQAAGWDGARALRPKDGAAEVLIALTGFTGALTALLRSLPAVLAEVRQRHRQREFEVIVERNGREVHHILIAGTSDAESVGELLRSVGPAAGEDGE